MKRKNAAAVLLLTVVTGMLLLMAEPPPQNKDNVVESTGDPHFWQTGWFIGAAAILFIGVSILIFRLRTDSLRQKLEKERLEKEVRLKADFTAMLVHELRSPLTAIIGYSKMMEEIPEKLDISRIGKIVTRSSENMLALVNDMLDLSKFEAGKMTLTRKNVRLFQIVTDFIEIMEPLVHNKKIDLVWEPDPGTESEILFLDPEKIGEVVNNFISNATKFTPEKGTIFIRLSRDYDEVGRAFLELSVTDDGPGVPEEKRKYLFDKYAQLNKEMKVKGTGLGLAVSRMIIDAHGGTIGFRAGIDGHGSTFYFALPYTPGEIKNEET